MAIFNIKNYLKTNLISGYQSGIFTTEQVAVYAGNFLVAGHFSEADVAEIAAATSPQEAEEPEA